jgi:hypothetical protein
MYIAKYMCIMLEQMFTFVALKNYNKNYVRDNIFEKSIALLFYHFDYLINYSEELLL